MSIHYQSDPFIRAQVRSLVCQERRESRSAAEWQSRLAGHGYSLRETSAGLIVTTLPHGLEICALGAEGDAGLTF